jgi:hypothetical protein
MQLKYKPLLGRYQYSGGVKPEPWEMMMKG